MRPVSREIDAGNAANPAFARRARPAAVMLLAATWLGTTGCFTLAKQAFHEAVGAKGDVVCISGGGSEALAGFRNLAFKPATTTVNSLLCPPELLRAYDRCANQSWAKLKTAYPDGAPTLSVDSEILYFQKKGLLSGAFMLTRVRMSSPAELVADALVRAESDAFRAGGEDDLARASCEALRAFIEQARQPSSPATEPRP